MTTPTETPRTDACPHCGAKPWDSGDTGYKCGSDFIQEDTDFPILYRSSFCYGNENSQLKQKLEKAEAEVERLHAFIKKCLELLDCDLPTLATKRLFDEYESQYRKLQ